VIIYQAEEFRGATLWRGGLTRNIIVVWDMPAGVKDGARNIETVTATRSGQISELSDL
jgi:hypothetical protein